MATGSDSFNYTSDEEEVFIGKTVGAKELVKSNMFGQNYNSPALGRCTPRPKYRLLPDVLKESTNKISNEQTKDTPNKMSSHNDLKSNLFPSANTSFSEDDDVIVIDHDQISENNSIQIISDDDESFIQNEKYVDDNNDENKLTSVNNGKIDIDLVPKKEVVSGINEENISLFTGADDVSINKNKEKYSLTLTESHSTSESSKNPNRSSFSNHTSSEKSLSGDSINLSGELGCKENLFSQTSEPKHTLPITNIPSPATFQSDPPATESTNNTPNSSIKAPNNTPVKMTAGSPFESAFDSNVTSTNPHQIIVSSHEKSLPISDNIQTLTRAKLSVNKTQFNVNASKTMFSIGALECSSLDAVSDSILNISHGSSISSPVPEAGSKRSLSLQSSTMCDTYNRDLLSDKVVADVSNAQNPIETCDDLHMSVDEVDSQEAKFSENFSTVVNISEQVTHSALLNTASDVSVPNTSSEDLSFRDKSSNSFQTYRKIENDSMIVDISKEHDSEVDEVNINEASFEIVVQNRQNSFNSTPIVKSGEMKDQIKPKMASKLPVFQASTSLLKPSKFCIKPDTLKTNSYKWAKQLSKTDNKNLLNDKKPELSKSKFIGSTANDKSSLKQHTKTERTPLKNNAALLTKGMDVTPRPPMKKIKHDKTPSKILKSPQITVGNSGTTSNPETKNIVPESKTPLQKSAVQNMPVKSPKIVLSDTKKKISSPNTNIVKSNTRDQDKKILALPGSTPNSLTKNTKPDNKTPLKNSASKNLSTKTPKLADSGIKNKKTPNSNVKGLILNEGNQKNKNVPLQVPVLKERNRYQNIISPVHAYITGTGTPYPKIQKKETSTEKVANRSNTKVTSHIPVMKHSPLKVSKVIQKLEFPQKQDQENVNPNNSLSEQISYPADAARLNDCFTEPKAKEPRARLLSNKPETELPCDTLETSKSVPEIVVTEDSCIETTDVLSPNSSLQQDGVSEPAGGISVQALEI